MAPKGVIYTIGMGKRPMYLRKSTAFCDGAAKMGIIFGIYFKRATFAATMVYWLRFRLLQIVRMVRTAGIGILLAMLVVTLPMWTNGLVGLGAIVPASMAALSAGACGLLHLFRSDADFLRKGALPLWQYALADYLLICAVIALAPLAAANWISVLAAFAGLVCTGLPMGMFLSKKSQRARFALQWLPPQAIEWRLLLRAQWPILLLTALLVVPCYIHVGFYGVAMTLAAGLLPAAFEYLEPFALRPPHRTAMLRRWRANARWMYLWLVPTGAYFLYFHAAWWPMVLYVVLVYESLLALFTAYKYHAWQPGRRRLYGGGIATVGTLAAIMPGGLVVLVPLAVYFLLKK